MLFNESISVFSPPSCQKSKSSHSAAMATSIGSDESASIATSNSESMSYLKKIDSKIDNVELKLKTLDKLENTVYAFEKDMKNMWSCLDKFTKKTDEKIQKADERLDNLEFTAGERYDEIKQLEKENNKYSQSQSMRNNLSFCNIEELQNDKTVETEKVVRDFMVDKLKLAHEYAKSLGIQRAHRMGLTHLVAGTHRERKLVVKFTLYKTREAIRSKRPELNGSWYCFHRWLLLNVAVWSRR